MESVSLGSPVGCEPDCSAPRGVAGRLRWGAVWVIGGRIAGIAVTLLANVMLAWRLAPDDFGKFNLLASLISIASTVIMLGLGGAVVRFIPESLSLGQFEKARKTLRVSYAIVIAMWIFAALTIVVNWQALANWLSMPTEYSFAWLLVASAGLLALLQLTAESLRSFHELRFASLLSGGQTGGLLSNALFLGMFAVWTFRGPSSLNSSLSLNVVAMLAVVPLALVFLVRTMQGERRLAVAGTSPGEVDVRPLLATLLAVCLPMMLVQCVTLASSQADLWIAGVHCRPDDLALYSAARRLMLLVTMPLQMANFLVISSIAELKAQNRLLQLESLLQTTSILAAIPAILALSLLALAGGSILQLLFGQFYRDAATPLAILIVGQFVLAWAGSTNITLVMTGHQNLVLAVSTASALLLIVGGSIAAERFGICGLAIASTLVVTLENIVLMVLARRLLKISPHVPANWQVLCDRFANLDVIRRLTARDAAVSPASEDPHAQ